MQKFINKIICGDCIELLNGAREPFADLIFADPPFNIGYKYDKYQDKVKRKKYIAWTMDWMSTCFNVLKPNGSFYIAIGDDYAADVKKISEDLELVMRNWIIWHYTFGQQTKNKFARSHTHIFYFTKDKSNFTFNDDSIRVFSDRQKIYNDKRANPKGKLPDDVWKEFPRICGTFEERTGWHPCQMPESVLARIIRASSNEGDVVLDPFAGSGTTAVVAMKLNRKYTGIDISKKYVRQAQHRLQRAKGRSIEGQGDKKWTEYAEQELKWLYYENQIPTEELFDNEFLFNLFTAKFNKRINENTNLYNQNDIERCLMGMRKSGKLGPLEKDKKKSSKTSKASKRKITAIGK